MAHKDQLFGYKIEDGEFRRGDSGYRSWISRQSGSQFPPEKDRYHLYVSLACPWSHRAVLVRKLRGLEEIISMSVTDPVWDEVGWVFEDGTHVLDLYKKTDPNFDEPETVPVLWDKKSQTIVNNESRDIMRMFDHEFETYATGADLCPPELKNKVERTLDEIYPSINNGVYRAGFAQSQKAYERAVTQLFAALDKLEVKLSKQRYLCGSVFTEADLALYVTLVRFEPVYYSHFKCNLRRLQEFPNLWRWLREVYQTPGVSETTDFDQIKKHYYKSQLDLNPTGIVPMGPILSLT